MAGESAEDDLTLEDRIRVVQVKLRLRGFSDAFIDMVGDEGEKRLVLWEMFGRGERLTMAQMEKLVGDWVNRYKKRSY